MRRTTARRQPIAKIIDAYPDAILLGLTATPCRGDGRGLGGIFEVIIECPQVAELIEQRLPGQDAGVCAGQSRISKASAPSSRRLRRIATRRSHGSTQADRRHRHPLAQVRRAPKDRRLRGQRRALAPSARRVHQVRRARRAHRWLDAEAGARRNACATGIRRDRACHELHGADRRLGHAGGGVLHPRATDPARWVCSAR